MLLKDAIDEAIESLPDGVEAEVVINAIEDGDEVRVWRVSDGEKAPDQVSLTVRASVRGRGTRRGTAGL